MDFIAVRGGRQLSTPVDTGQMMTPMVLAGEGFNAGLVTADVARNTASDAVLAEGRRVLIDDAARFGSVTAIGVDEHVWHHTRCCDTYITVIIGPTAVRAGTGPARPQRWVLGRCYCG